MKKMQNSVTIQLLICITIIQVCNCWSVGNREDNGDSDASDWEGPWFPAKPKALHQKIDPKLYDSMHGVQMGIPSGCDDGLINVTMDWNYSSTDYVCYDEKWKYEPRLDIAPILKCEHIPPGYSAMHACMDEHIVYQEKIPTFGTHRPLWPRYGEYNYVPVQRWLHNLEHGAVVLLYHPCINRQELKLAKDIVKGCLYRHIITPYKYLDPGRPVALVTWGCRLEFSKVDTELMVDFIQTKALKGPEKVHRDGQFEQQLIDAARVVSTPDDKTLCPMF